ncbi:MAG: hypothetical protein GW886_08695 [Rhodobacterales bacterium]|nr:hypothetical protein [Rhodobacterales bacterium]NCT12723.1 hypothetical protein [Rhodobacterales bacterium]
MSSSDRPRPPSRRAALLGFAALAGCGFAPVYGPDSAALALRDSVAVDAPQTVDGYRLRRALEDRLGRAAPPAFRLSLSYDVTESATAITPGGTASRSTLAGVVRYALRAEGGEAVLVQGQVDSFASYATTGTTVATRAAAEDARARLAMGLADLLVTRLTLSAPGR